MTWIRHLQDQAEKGFLFRYNDANPIAISNYTLYENELLVNDNAMIVELDGVKTSYLTYNVHNVLGTSEPQITNTIYQHLQAVIGNAIQLSSNGAKARGHFFNRLVDQVLQFKQNL